MTTGADWGGRTALVVGCSGFVGRWLASRLSEKGARVIGFSRHKPRICGLVPKCASNSSITYVEGSVADCSLLQRTMRDFKVDTVFHLAAQAKVDVGRHSPVETFESNVRGTWNVLDAAVASEQKIRVMVASTEMVYANSSNSPHNESSPVDARTPYSASKFCAEVLAKCYHQTYGLPVCIARTSNVYGGGDTSFERIIPGTIRSALHNEEPVINSDGRPKREYLYVEDAIAGYMMLTSAMDDQDICGETFNFSSDMPVSVLSVVETILKLTDRTHLKPKVLGRNSNETDARHASSSKAFKKLGWRADTSFESGLGKTIAWYQAHLKELIAEAQR